MATARLSTDVSGETPTLLSRALAGARETKSLEIGWRVLNRLPSMARQLFGSLPVMVVMDENTEKAAGNRVLRELEKADHPTRAPFVFRSPDLYAEHRFVSELEKALEGHDAIPISVGSGTINDLVKLAAFRQKRSYISVATAASMDGYTAFGASITHIGSKQTFTCPAPSGVVADLETICAAPVAMNASGYADLLAKITAGADWLLADALDVDPLIQDAWDIVQSGLRAAIANPEGIVQRDPNAIAKLTDGLMMGGFAMQRAQSSRPASGAEHQFSHLWDMQHHTHQGVAPSHGFKVGIGTLASAALYEFLLEQPLEKLEFHSLAESMPDTNVVVDRARSIFGESDLSEIASVELRAKHPGRADLRQQLQKLAAVWPDCRDRLREQLLPFDELKRRLRLAGAPFEPEHIGISRQRLRDSFWPAFSIRRRFTVLDLAVRTGLLEPALAAIFGPQGRWPF
jgi:glycerol-1-phosphate dehydrogenase [NAD(P)+]